MAIFSTVETLVWFPWASTVKPPSAGGFYNQLRSLEYRIMFPLNGFLGNLSTIEFLKNWNISKWKSAYNKGISLLDLNICDSSKFLEKLLQLLLLNLIRDVLNIDLGIIIFFLSAPVPRVISILSFPIAVSRVLFSLFVAILSWGFLYYWTFAPVVRATFVITPSLRASLILALLW